MSKTEDFYKTKGIFSESLEMRQACEVAMKLSGLGPHAFIKQDLFEFAEAYHQSRVNNISDEKAFEVSDKNYSFDRSGKQRRAWRYGYKWFKEQLLKQ